MRFIFLDRRPLPDPRRSHWRLVRSALVVASLALSMCTFISVGMLRAGLTASAAPALAATASPPASGACVPLDGDEHPYTPAELALPYDVGTFQRGDAIVGLCMIPREIPTPDVAPPTQQGQVILVSRDQQWLWAYDNGRLVFATPVTTGQPGLSTPLGVYHVMGKRANTTFYSPWPKGSRYYYPPLHINYALLFRAGGFYIHDAPWRYEFGPGTNLLLQLPDGTSQTGSHGCVDVPTNAGAWLYQWARVGAVIAIVDGGEPHQSLSMPTKHNAAA
jgi:L,D-transpeptidase-like protein